LYTEALDSDFYRRESDNLALDLVYWYNKNCIATDTGSYIPAEVLAGKLFIDDYEVTSLYLQKTVSNEFLLFETDYDYDLGEPMKLIQYHSTSSVPRGTIDIM
jgi:hypothetical protein